MKKKYQSKAAVTRRSFSAGLGAAGIVAGTAPFNIVRAQGAALKVGVLRTLKGVHLAFTGILSKRRSEAIRAARRAGAIIHSGPSAKTSVVVRGRPNPLQAAGREAGLKLMEIKRLREKGQRITLLNEKQFWRLVAARR